LIETQHGWEQFIGRTFDELGRLTRVEHTNPGLDWVPAADRVVVCDFKYDALSRVAYEAISVGATSVGAVLSEWDVTGSSWRRRASVFAGGTPRHFVETYDAGGRLRQQTVSAGAADSRTIDYNWIGSIYAGRVQELSSPGSPLRETIDLDGFGGVRTCSWRFIDLDEAGRPLDQAEGDRYCRRGWLRRCGRPLLRSTYVHDPIGRVTSATARWSVPDDGRDVTHYSWWGVAYDERRNIIRFWEDFGDKLGVDPLALIDYKADAVAVAQVAQSGRARRWRYKRHPAGDTDAIYSNRQAQHKA
jgi:hypothetical protein